LNQNIQLILSLDYSTNFELHENISLLCNHANGIEHFTTAQREL